MFWLLLMFLVSPIVGEAIFENATDICQTKCTCNKSQDLQTLNLNCSYQNFHYILSNWPPHNSSLLRASFVGNNISTLETLPPSDAYIEVSFAKCNIENLYPNLFGSTKNIKMVDFSYNYLTAETMKPEVFSGPYRDGKMEQIKLEELNLAYNRIHSLDKNLFKFIPDLKRLNLEGNDFVVLDIATQFALSSLTGLVSLNLANNELTELVASAIDRCKNLTELNLSKNQLDFVPYDLKMVGKSLKILILDDNPIIELTNETFLGLGNLTELSANNLTKLKHINASAFAPTSSLNKLTLSNNILLETIDKNAFSPNQTITELNIGNNNLHHIDYELLQWQKLKVFEMGENPLECDCDLYKIASALSSEIKRDGPYCAYEGNYTIAFALNSAICEQPKLRRLTYHHFSIPLAGLIATLILALTLAITLGFNRYRRFLVRHKDPNSQVLYSPLPIPSPRC